MGNKKSSVLGLRLSVMCLVLAISLLAMPSPVKAHCPLCTAAVGSGLVIARSMGIDDSVVGIWVGALIISSALWLDKLLVKRNKKIPFQSWIIIAVFFLLTVVPFYLSNMINFQNTFFGVDKLLFGTIMGCIVTLAGFKLSKMLRNENNKPLMPFQSIILTIAILVISNLVITLAL